MLRAIFAILVTLGMTIWLVDPENDDDVYDALQAALSLGDTEY